MASNAFNNSLEILSPKSIDKRYGKFVSGSFKGYADVADANASIDSAYRHLGLTVLIGPDVTNIEEYWYKGGIGNGNLVKKRLISSVTSPLTIDSSGVLSIAVATSSTSGILSSTDWSTFTNKLTTANTASSLTGSGRPEAPITLINDMVNPGSSKVYGTDSLGVRGWYDGGGLGTGSGSGLTTFVTTTTNATPKTLAVINSTYPANSVGIVEVVLVAVGGSIGDKALVGRKYAKYKRETNGTVNIIGAVGDVIDDTGINTSATWTIITNETTNKLEIEVTGEPSTTFKWTADVRQTAIQI